MPGHPQRSAGARAAHPGAERRLASLFRGAAEAGGQGRRDDGKRRARHGVRPAAGVARIPPASRIAQGARERQRDLADARAHRRAAGRRGSPRPVCRAAARADIRARADAQLFAVGRAWHPYYRVSVKREAHGAAGAYIDDELQVGDTVQASAARGSFTLRPGDAPVVLLSAGIGVTPVLAMLHAMAAEASTAGNLVAVRNP